MGLEKCKHRIWIVTDILSGSFPKNSNKSILINFIVIRLQEESAAAATLVERENAKV
jgi:hypothetical protein